MYTSTEQHTFSLVLAFLGLCASVAGAFSVQYSQPAQCDNFNASWSGGEPPFELYIIPLYGRPKNISIPSSAIDGNTGSYSTQLQLPQNKQLLAMIFDATGIPFGAVSQLLTVGATVDGATCNTTLLHPDFEFDAARDAVQCQPYLLSDYANAILPVTLMVVVPGQDPVYVYPSATDTSFNWTVNMVAGTSVVLVMTDAMGRQGGTTKVLTVESSNDLSCITYSSTSAFPSQTSSTGSSASPSGSTQSNDSTKHSTASKIEIAVPIAVAVIIALALLYACVRRRRRSAMVGERPDLLGSTGEPSTVEVGGYISPDHGRISPFPPVPTGYIYHPLAYHDASYSSVTSSAKPPNQDLSKDERNTSRDSHPSPQLSYSSEVNLSNDRASGEKARRNMSRPARVVVHRDVEEVLRDEPEEVVDLPPEYREDRKPLSGLPLSGLISKGKNSRDN